MPFATSWILVANLKEESIINFNQCIALTSYAVSSVNDFRSIDRFVDGDIVFDDGVMIQCVQFVLAKPASYYRVPRRSLLLALAKKFVRFFPRHDKVL